MVAGLVGVGTIMVELATLSKKVLENAIEAQSEDVEPQRLR
jgi:hypothetical protein